MNRQALLAVLTILILLSGCTIEPNTTARQPLNESSSIPQTMPEEDNLEVLLSIVNEQYLPTLGSMINCEDWNCAEEIPVSMYYAWYRDFINSTTTPEEQTERYSYQDAPGWAYPAEELEIHVMQYFPVSTDYLRGSDIYQAAEQVYWIPAGGTNITYRARADSVEALSIEDGRLSVYVSCSLRGDFSDTIYKVLTIDRSKELWQFIGCVAAS